MTRIVQIVTTTAEQGDAERIASTLVAERWAACVQIDGPITSHYRWQDQLERATEWRLTIKTAEAIAARVVDAVRALHPYDEPEILVTRVVGGSAGYLRWVLDQVRPVESL